MYEHWKCWKTLWLPLHPNRRKIKKKTLLTPPTLLQRVNGILFCRNLEMIMFGCQSSRCVVVELGDELPSPPDIQLAHSRLRALCLGGGDKTWIHTSTQNLRKYYMQWHTRIYREWWQIKHPHLSLIVKASVTSSWATFWSKNSHIYLFTLITYLCQELMCCSNLWASLKLLIFNHI